MNIWDDWEWEGLHTDTGIKVVAYSQTKLGDEGEILIEPGSERLKWKTDSGQTKVLEGTTLKTFDGSDIEGNPSKTESNQKLLDLWKGIPPDNACGMVRAGEVAVKEAVTAGAFIRPQDIKKLYDFAATHSIFVSVRRTGKASVDRLADPAGTVAQPTGGFASKPHSILEKSLKPGSMLKEIDNLKRAINGLKQYEPRTGFMASGPLKADLECIVFPQRTYLKYMLPDVTEANVDLAYVLRTAENSNTGAKQPRYKSRYNPKKTHDVKVIGVDDPGQGSIEWKASDGFEKLIETCLLDEGGAKISSGGPKDPATTGLRHLGEHGRPENVIITAAGVKDLIEKLLGKAEDHLTTLSSQMKGNYEGIVGWWFKIRVVSHIDPCFKDKSGTSVNQVEVNIPVGVLRVGQKDAGSDASAPHGVPMSFKKVRNASYGVPCDGYTGDYDLHCIYRGNRKPFDDEDPSYRPKTAHHRAPTATAATQTLHSLGAHLHGLNTVLSRERNEADPTKPSTRKDKLADRLSLLIQHGPQSLYRLFVEHERRSHNVTFKDILELRNLEDLFDQYQWNVAEIERLDKEIQHARRDQDDAAGLKFRVEKSTCEQKLKQIEGVAERAPYKLWKPNENPNSLTVESHMKTSISTRKNNLLETAAEQKMVQALLDVDTGGVVAFTPGRKVYLLNSKEEVLLFYRQHGIVDGLWAYGQQAQYLSSYDTTRKLIDEALQH